MARAYFDDLRRKLLEAHEQGEGGLRELARRFRVSEASLCYLPPCSPDFNPIEKCGAQMKQRLRTLEARSVHALQEALPQALSTLTSQHAANYFRHCGYAL